MVVAPPSPRIVIKRQRSTAAGFLEDELKSEPPPAKGGDLQQIVD